ncbi:THUMP-like domain-containing protein [Arundinibacter roseus]|uniref:Uncharacterized protein n=1 Tax=Arundinibacter roseus TaxID=2070510 RepID=A0A4R4KIJ8_9BACT|nr:hypothetical protein [Arundinibacter roseus]TDB67958.1 hypothetical protein EZE20_03250 [Arundinibacter roseus]
MTTFSNIPALSKEDQAFISKHIQEDTSALLLRHQAMPGIRMLVGQIAARQKARKKLPEWYANPALIFPPPLSVEQSSSETTARFKATLCHGNCLIDTTGGMGVDCYYMSKVFEKVIYLENQPQVAHTAAHNFGALGATKITVCAENAVDYLNQTNATADVIYSDPARRDGLQRKIAQLNDCTPDLTKVLPTLLRAAPLILVKTAPLLDIDQAISQLAHVRDVYVIGLDGECKEVLYFLDAQKRMSTDIPIRVRVLFPDAQVQHAFDFTRGEEQHVTTTFSDPQSFLYEPHPALLKSGAFKTVAERFGLAKLAQHTHLYTSRHFVADFPGRSFEIRAVCKPNAREIAAYVPDGKANLTVRNFPAKTDDLRKKWRLKEGGDTYLFAAELKNSQKVVIITRKPTHSDGTND